ncbi:SEC-C domain-containing protein [candidate division KSB1 bacterium]|nr:SEC-C domain-containing protein [candidate division KSB1 bacterium]
MIKIQRNEKCPCGSGKKFKKCCFLDNFKNSEIERAARSANSYDELIQMISKPLDMYQLKVKLVRMMFNVIEDEIYRTIEIKGNQSLYDLHLEIQHAFHWDNDHMFSFYFGGKLFDRENEYSGNPSGSHIVSNIGKSSRSAADTQLRDLNLEKDATFLYLFDFGDELVHEIVVENKREINPNENGYTKIIKEVGVVPAQYGDYD